MIEIRVWDERNLRMSPPSNAPETIQTKKFYESGSQGKDMVPEVIIAKWAREADERWGLHTLEVRGAVLKKDGTPGMVNGEHHYYSMGRVYSEPPLWLLQAIQPFVPKP